MNSENKTQHGALYGYWSIRPGFWVISNGWQCFQYLLIGETGAVLIDTGYGEGNIRAIAERITQKPIRPVNTHGHFDHTGGNGCWPKVWMSEGSKRDCRRAFSRQNDEWAAAKPYPDYETCVLTDGTILDLGGETLEVFAIPAHHDGSIALLAKQNRALFTGDEFESGQVLILKEQSDPSFLPTIVRHRQHAERLLSRQAEYDYLFPAHNGYMLDAKRYLGDFIELDTRILNGKAEAQSDTAGFNYPADPVGSGSIFGMFGVQQRVSFGVASIVYRNNPVSK
mgnify:CR=1 FL=1